MLVERTLVKGTRLKFAKIDVILMDDTVICCEESEWKHIERQLLVQITINSEPVLATV